ncbi:uncharacterized protein LOC131597703 [Vicia villosa]|uniref:uncharacterized protein LOC131597703 n=1 Tax=Vicia villosa TaxID=3911 RepID=UPI00273AD649|nr:uncharacterized protein LOC131597703 [Vicia villosa]
MLVLVNDNPTKEFVVERGLRQGDPLSLFLFVIVAEGLKILVNKAVENGDYVGCNVKGNCFVDVLQFTDDTLLVGDGSRKHLWAIKSVLRGFDLVLGFGINFNKSKLIGININSHFLEVATSFLSCKLESKEFSFLGICIGSNPRMIAFWRPVEEKFRKRLCSWKGRWLSFGGRINLLKSVLGSLPILSFSFYLAPKKVIQEINKIQGNFLWGGVKAKRGIHWVKWKEVCLPVDKGGLGLRCLEDFNLALLIKWKWRIMETSNSLWYRMLRVRYEDIKLRLVIEGGRRDHYSSKSVWWSGVISLKKILPTIFFVNNCCFRIGDGFSTSFWHAHWLEEGIIRNMFPSLFEISCLQDVSIAGIGGWSDEGWHWNDFGIPVLHRAAAAAEAGVLRCML